MWTWPSTCAGLCVSVPAQRSTLIPFGLLANVCQADSVSVWKQGINTSCFFKWWSVWHFGKRRPSSPFWCPLLPSQGYLMLEPKACWERCRQRGWRRSSGCRGLCLGCSVARRSRAAAGADSRWAGGGATWGCVTKRRKKGRTEGKGGRRWAPR